MVRQSISPEPAWRGSGTRASQTSGNRHTSTPTKRRKRKVIGSAYGMPYLATIKPVLQISTNSHGMATTNREWESRADAGVAEYA
jgi:hypothetical protein